MSIVNTPVKIWRRKQRLSSLIGKIGTIESVTIVRVAPTGFSQYTPFPVAIVKLNNGQKMIGQVVETDILEIGQKVVAILRRSRTEGKKDAISYVIKFRLL